MLLIKDCIELCRDGVERHLDIDKFTKTILHRIDFSEDDGAGGVHKGVHKIPADQLTGPLVAARFRDKRKASSQPRYTDRPGAYTGGQMPYGIVITTAGEVHQCLRLSDYGPHARRWSDDGFGVAFVGDFRRHPPTPSQIGAARELLPLLAAMGTEVVGHTDLPGASGDPLKECPGPLFPTTALANEAANEAADMSEGEAITALTNAGMVF